MTEFDRSRYETELDRDRSPHLGIWRDEHDDLTREFFDWNVPELPDSLQQAIAAGYGTVVYATIHFSDDDRAGAQLIHAVRRTPWGSEMRSRFIQPAGVVELIGPALLDHCYTEMTHLASFLPHLHAQVNARGPTS